MWEIENNPDILCIDKDEKAEQFLCDSYQIEKPDLSPLKDVKPDNLAPVIATNFSLTSITTTGKSNGSRDDRSDNNKTVTKKEALFDSLDFSDDESEDMSSLYAKLIIIAGSDDPPHSALNVDKPFSSTVNYEGIAIENNDDTKNIKPCWVMVEKMDELFINDMLGIVPTNCVSSTGNMEPCVVETITIDSDDNQSIPEKLSVAEFNNSKPTKIQLPNTKVPKLTVEKNVEELRREKPINTLTTQKVVNKTKERTNKKVIIKTVKKKKEATLSFDNLFNKRFTILGSGLKIGKKAITAPQNADLEERKEEVIDLVDDEEDARNCDKYAETTTLCNSKFEDKTIDHEESNIAGDDDSESNGSWTAHKPKTNDVIEIDDCNIAGDDDNESNGSWTAHKPKTNDVIEIEDDEEVEVKRMAENGDTMMNKAQERYEPYEVEEADINVITSNEEYYEEAVMDGEEYVEEEGEDGEIFEWRPIELENGRSKWFDVDKYNYCRSPPRYCDLVESKVINPPPDDGIVMNDRFYHLWSDDKERFNRHYQPRSYAHRFMSPYSERVVPPHINDHYDQRYPYMDPTAPQYPSRIVSGRKRGYQDTDMPNDDEPREQSFDVWKRLIESKKQYWKQRGYHHFHGCEPIGPPRHTHRHPSNIDRDPRNRLRANHMSHYPYGIPFNYPPPQYYPPHHSDRYIYNKDPIPITPESPDPVIADEETMPCERVSDSSMTEMPVASSLRSSFEFNKTGTTINTHSPASPTLVGNEESHTCEHTCEHTPTLSSLVSKERSRQCSYNSASPLFDKEVSQKRVETSASLELVGKEGSQTCIKTSPSLVDKQVSQQCIRTPVLPPKNTLPSTSMLSSMINNEDSTHGVFAPASPTGVAKSSSVMKESPDPDAYIVTSRPAINIRVSEHNMYPTVSSEVSKDVSASNSPVWDTTDGSANNTHSPASSSHLYTTTPSPGMTIQHLHSEECTHASSSIITKKSSHQPTDTVIDCIDANHTMSTTSTNQHLVHNYINPSLESEIIVSENTIADV